MRYLTLLSALVLIVHAHAAAQGGLPADAEGAAEALAQSPRHGEWVDVPMAEGEAAIQTWVVYPERDDEAPVVVVIHEIFGLTDWVRAVADQLAAEGYIAVAPDLLSGMGPGGGGTASLGADVRQVIRTLTPQQRAARLDAVRQYALDLPAASERSACIGFCWGGSTSFIYAARQPGLDAAVVYYGTAPQKEQLADIECPVIGFYGGDDARVTSTVDSTRQQMRELDKPYAAHVYEGAGHGFLRRQSGRDGANGAAAEQAWAATLAFLAEHLEANGH